MAFISLPGPILVVLFFIILFDYLKIKRREKENKKYFENWLKAYVLKTTEEDTYNVNVSLRHEFHENEDEKPSKPLQ